MTPVYTFEKGLTPKTKIFAFSSPAYWNKNMKNINLISSNEGVEKYDI
jgi:hypothetical protein